MDGVQLSQGYIATTKKQITTKFPGIPGTRFLDLERMKGRVDHVATQ